MPTLAELFSQAKRSHQSGQLGPAENLYRQILQMDATHADAWHFLGLLMRQAGRLDLAVEYIGQALRFIPDFAPAHYNLGVVFGEQGKLEQAKSCYHQALRLKPDYVDAHSNLGVIFRDQGKLADAEASYRQALRFKPDHAQTISNLGNVLRDQGRLAEAEACCREALRLKPDLAEAHSNLGNVLGDQGKLAEAKACYRDALRLKPAYAEAHVNFGNLLCEQGQLKEAEACCREALRLQPNCALAYNGLANILSDQGHVDEAVACYRQALRLQPDNALAHSNLLLALNYDDRMKPEGVFEEHCRWGQQHGQKEQMVISSAVSRDPERRLRIGYVSPDFRSNVVMRFLEPVLANHDPRRVEIICYAEVTRPDETTASAKAMVHGWRWTHGKSARAVAQWIAEDKIDILVDLAGHIKNNRLDVFALKPAPVQVTWLGYSNTTGLATMDYRLTDAILDPPGRPVLDVEELIRMPRSWVCFSPTRQTPPLTPLPALQTGRLTFGSLHKLNKINGRVLDLWSRVLQAVPSARLLMFRHTLVGAVQEAVCQEFLKRGIAQERLDIRRGSADVGLGVYREIDISMDAFPFSGGATTCDSLWMGAPMLSLAGPRPASRGSATLLTNIGLSDWVTTTEEEFVMLAQRWANDLEGLSAIRAGLRDRMQATLCDGPRFTRELEDVYRAMWRRWCHN